MFRPLCQIFHGFMLMAALFLICFPPKAQAQELSEPRFNFPVACDRGQNCWTTNYVDVEPSEDSVRDFMCGPRSYEGHKGTDFALATIKDMKAGVDVLAALDGTVTRFRDGESDSVKTREQLDQIREQNKDCGNGIVIDHGSAGYLGWQTIYCHLRAGTIQLRQGQKVKAGEKLAEIGHSGYTEFPHLHFGVLKNNVFIDPYTGLAKEEGCGKGGQSLWLDKNMSYEPLALYGAGFMFEEPDFEDIKRGRQQEELEDGESPDALILWASFYGLQSNDRIIMEIKGPGGDVFVNRIIDQKANKARQFYYTGRRISADNPLHAGTYEGRLIVERQTQNGPIRIERGLDRAIGLE